MYYFLKGYETLAAGIFITLLYAEIFIVWYWTDIIKSINTLFDKIKIFLRFHAPEGN